MPTIGTFPFGQLILPVVQHDRGVKRVFVLGVYAGAVHAHWMRPDGRQRISAVAVASLDPFNLAIGPFIHGGDAGGIAAGLGIGRYAVQAVAPGVR